MQEPNQHLYGDIKYWYQVAQTIAYIIDDSNEGTRGLSIQKVGASKRPE